MSIFYFPDKFSKSDHAKKRKEHMRQIVSEYRKKKGLDKPKKYKPETLLEKKLFKDHEWWIGSESPKWQTKEAVSPIQENSFFCPATNANRLVFKREKSLLTGFHYPTTQPADVLSIGSAVWIPWFHPYPVECLMLSSL
jgi:hypothetical protein